MRTCVICKCFSIPGNTSRTFHKFPDDCTLKEKWLKALHLSSVPKSATVCSKHFEECAFHKTDGYTTLRRLLADAVPISKMCTQRDDDLTRENQNASTLSSTSSAGVSLPIPKNDDLSDTAIEPVPSSNDTTFITPALQVLQESTDLIDNDSNSVNVKTGHSSVSSVLANCNDDCKNRKRKSPFCTNDIDEVDIKKVRFIDDFETKYVSRSDFVSDEAWKRFLQYKIYRDKQQEKNRKRNCRMSKKLKNLNDVVKSLKGQQNFSAAQYLEVL